MIMKTVLTLSLSLLISSFGVQQKVFLRVDIASKEVKSRKDLDVKLTLVNRTNEPLIIQKLVEVGYCKEAEAQICFEVEKYINLKYVPLEWAANIDRVPAFDSSGNLLSFQIAVVSPNDSLVKISSLIPYFSFDRGKYRVKVYWKFHSFSENMELFAKSDWIYFDVRTNLVY